MCSFCARPQEANRRLIAGPRPELFICNQCVELCKEIFRETAGPPPPPHPHRSSGGASSPGGR
ncbi:MAG TPA: ClpX C4-type zinc finger protein [Dehalococcoidia bacterium]|nr:ClpX C4-type zinc finger protein [Dehalococcoidia bacterium]